MTNAIRKQTRKVYPSVFRDQKRKNKKTKTDSIVLYRTSLSKGLHPLEERLGKGCIIYNYINNSLHLS